MNNNLQSKPQLYGATIDLSQQQEAFTRGEIPVGVYGLGKMGLPLATVIAGVSGNVIGADINPTVVTEIRDGRCPVAGEPGLDDAVNRVVTDGALRATNVPEDAAEEASLHFIIVPTVLDGNSEPDLSAVSVVCGAIGRGLSAGDMVFVESTVPPGTCRDVVQPRLAEMSGLDPGAFGLAFCPERSASGQALADIRGSYPKIVGGRDPESTRVAQLVYGEITDNEIVTVSDLSTAECVKVFEGLYRDVNIALANELAGLVDAFDVDVREAIDGANTQPFCDIHEPGPGVGGHCIPYYPYFVLNGTTPLPLVQLARKTNESMPFRTANWVATELERAGKALDQSTVVLLGVTYRPGIDETRASPTYPLATRLTERGATVFATDPVCSAPGDIDARMISLDEVGATDPDAMVLVTGHEAFRSLPWAAFDDLVVIDGRDFFDASVPHPVYTVGRGRRGGSVQAEGGSRE